MLSHASIWTFIAGNLAIFQAEASPASPSLRARSPWDDNNWHKYIRSPSSPVVKPKGILESNTTGAVTNADGLITGNGPTILTRETTDDEPPTIIVDFGINVVGLVSLHFEGSNSSTDSLPGLKLAFSETEECLTDRSDFSRSDNARHDVDKLTSGTDQVAVKNEVYEWKDKWGCEYDGKVCADGLHGFRYVKIWLDALESDAPHTSPTGSVSIASIDLEWSAYLGTPDSFTGWFECSDEDITQWWFDGVYTVDINTDFFLKNETEPRDAYSPTLDGKQVLHDGAKRDRDPYVGDLAIASLTSYLSHDFAEATFNVLEDLALHQREDGWIPPASINNYTLPLFDYPLWWVVCSVDLVMYTGNTSYAETYWEALTKTLDGYYPGFIDATTNLVVKPAEIDHGDYAFLPRSGPITYYNALYVHALRYAGQLATFLGKVEDEERWSARATQVGEALLEHNFDTSVGAFYDGGPCPGGDVGTYCDVHAQDGNSIAILYGVTNDTISTSILDYWTEAASYPYGNAFYDSSILSPDNRFDERVYALMSYFELAARMATPGTQESAYDEIRRLYGWMATHDPGVTMWEGIGPNGGLYQGGFTSMAHGWSTGIVPVMSNYVLGVTPVDPGFATWQIRPVVEGGDLSWAKGVVPTPSGGIKVSWERHDVEAGDVLTLEIETPEGTKGVVHVPTLGLEGATVTLDGEVVDKPVEGGYVLIDASGGSHSITVSV